MAYARSEDILADFAHQLRQPLSALEALTSYLDLITTPSDLRVREQLLRIIEPISGAVTIVSYEPVSDGKGKIQSYKVLAQRE